MKKDNLNIICCPVCKGDMKLQVIKTSKDDVIEGTMRCEQCSNRYFIWNGTAFLVPASVPLEAKYPFYIDRKPDENSECDNNNGT